MNWIDEWGDKRAFIAKVGGIGIYIVKNMGYKARGYELRVAKGRESFKVLGEYGTLAQAKEAAESWVLAGMSMRVAQEYRMGPIKHKYKRY